MPRDSCSPGQDDDHAEKAVTLQAFLSTAKEVIPVFTSALARTSLLRSGLSVLQLKLIGLSNPHELLALETPVLTKLSDCLQELFYQLDGLVDKDVQEKARYFHGIVQQHIDSQSNDPELCPEEIEEKRQDQGKGRNGHSNLQNLEALQRILSCRGLLESGDMVVSSEYNKTLSTVTSGCVVDVGRAVQNETHILECCDLFKLAIDRAWPESAAGIEDLIMGKDAVRDQVEDVLVRTEDATKTCAQLERVYKLLSKQLQHCMSTRHVAKFHLSGLRCGTIGFLFSGCDKTQGWHPVPCRIHHDTCRMPPFRGCGDFRFADACNECLTLNLSKDQKIFTKHVPKSSELGREYGTVPKKFLTLEKILNTNKSDQAGREVMGPGMMRRFYTRLMAMVSRTPKQELNDEDVVTVQYLLSESVLHLYDSPWLVDIWQPGHIEFPKDGTLLDFRRPHYPSPLLIDSLEESMPDQVTILDPDDYAEKFMAKFGLLLLQLQLRQRFPLETRNQGDELWAPIALGEYFEQYKDSVQPIKEVVDACLHFRSHLFHDVDAPEKSDTFRFRMVFYKRILMPLQAILLINCPKIAIGIQNSLVCNTTAQDEPQQVLDTQLREGTTRVERNGTSSKVAPYSHALGGTMLKRSGPATSTEWFNNLDILNEYLTAHACEVDEPYETNQVKIAVIDSGLWEARQGDANITYKNFVKEGKYKDNPQHGTNSVDLICKVYGRADLYIAKVFEGNEARKNTSKYMAEAIKWAISKKVDIISISAGFKQEGHDELEAQIKMATAGGAEPEILVFAAASNWQNISGIAYPASMTDRVICIFCCNGGLKPSRQWNPNPQNHAANFAFLGEDVILDSAAKPLCGTSVSTALAAGLAAKLLDFSRQPDVQSWISKAGRDKMRTKAGMSAILKEMSRKSVSEKYECVAPWKILPAQLDHDRKKIREAICTIIEKAME